MMKKCGGKHTDYYLKRLLPGQEQLKDFGPSPTLHYIYIKHSNQSSQLDYCSLVWGNSVKTLFDRLQSFRTVLLVFYIVVKCFVGYQSSLLEQSETLKMQAFLFLFFLCVSYANGRRYSQAFLAETVETGDKNRRNFHCMQMSLVISMRFVLGDD